MLLPLRSLSFIALTFWCLLLSPFKLSAAEYGVNLIQNGGAESGTLENSGWSLGILSSWEVKSSNPAPLEGDYYFFSKAGVNFLPSSLFQEVDVSSYAEAIDAGAQCFELSAGIAGYNEGIESEVSVSFVKSNGVSLQSSGGIHHPKEVVSWRRHKTIVFPSVDTRSIRVYLSSTRGLDEPRGYFDDVSLKAIDPKNCNPRYTANLLYNGGGEGDLGGWSIQSGDWEIRKSDPDPREGGGYFYAKLSEGTVVLSQNIDLASYQEDINKGIQHFKVSAYMSGSNGWDRAHQTYTFYDANGKAQAYFTSPTIQSSKQWKYASQNIKAPKGATRLKVQLHSYRRWGIQNDAYHDDVKVVALDPAKFQSRELLFNGGAEMNPTSYGWKAEKGRWSVDTTDPKPKKGNAYFYCLDKYGRLYQDVDVSQFSDAIDLGVQEFRYEGWHAGSNSTDQSEVAVQYRSAPDSNGKVSVLSTWYSGRIKTSQNWVKRGHTRIAPKGTRTIRVYITSWLVSVWYINNKNDGHVDALSLINLPVDVDGDGIPTVKERQWGLNPNDPADAGLDLDNDGFTNRQEYRLGTDASNADDIPMLRIEAFYSDKPHVNFRENEEVTLHWKTTGAESVEVYEAGILLRADNHEGSREQVGSLVVYPEQETTGRLESTYNLVAKGVNNASTSSIKISIKERQEMPAWPEPLPVGHGFILDSMTVLADESHFVSHKDEYYAFYANDGDTKTLQWKIDHLGSVYHKATLVNDLAIVGTVSNSRSRGNVAAIRTDGTIAWSFEAASPVRAKPIADSLGTTLFAVDYFGKVYALDVLTGELKWSYQLPGGNVVVINQPVLKEVTTVQGDVDIPNSVLIIRSVANHVFAYKTDGNSGSLIWQKTL